MAVKCNRWMIFRDFLTMNLSFAALQRYNKAITLLFPNEEEYLEAKLEVGTWQRYRAPHIYHPGINDRTPCQSWLPIGGNDDEKGLTLNSESGQNHSRSGGKRENRTIM